MIRLGQALLLCLAILLASCRFVNEPPKKIDRIGGEITIVLGKADRTVMKDFGNDWCYKVKDIGGLTYPNTGYVLFKTTETGSLRLTLHMKAAVSGTLRWLCAGNLSYFPSYNQAAGTVMKGPAKPAHYYLEEFRFDGPNEYSVGVVKFNLTQFET